jgi:hypothetical protein
VTFSQISHFAQNGYLNIYSTQLTYMTKFIYLKAKGCKTNKLLDLAIALVPIGLYGYFKGNKELLNMFNPCEELFQNALI